MACWEQLSLTGFTVVSSSSPRSVLTRICPSPRGVHSTAGSQFSGKLGFLKTPFQSLEWDCMFFCCGVCSSKNQRWQFCPAAVFRPRLSGAGGALTSCSSSFGITLFFIEGSCDSPTQVSGRII